MNEASMLHLTEAAQISLKRLISKRDPESRDPETGTPREFGLRIAVQRGGCAGMQYTLKLETKQEQDLLVEEGNCHVFLDQESLPFLENCTLDYRDSLHDAGFILHNPQATRSCGCGTSFEPSSGSPDAASLPHPAQPGSDQPCTSEESSSN